MLAVGHAATRRGNRLGLVAFGAEDPRFRRPRQGRRALLLTLEALREEPGGSGRLGDALALVDGLAVQRSLVVVVSDFRGPCRLAAIRCFVLPGGIRRSPSRSAIRASRSWPTSASCSSSTPRPGAGFASTRATARCASASPPRRRGAAQPRDDARVGGRPARRALHGRRLASAARDVPASERPGEVSFAAPILLLGLVAVPVLTVLYIVFEKRRERRADTWTTPRWRRTSSTVRHAAFGISR